MKLCYFHKDAVSSNKSEHPKKNIYLNSQQEFKILIRW